MKQETNGKAQGCRTKDFKKMMSNCSCCDPAKMKKFMKKMKNSGFCGLFNSNGKTKNNNCC
ncbi:MAG: hypothetical protein GY760_05780 [Deltaproteobacteria bacterium]|nr:hypothetical protein [Deltaproteobacteria bacterium]